MKPILPLKRGVKYRTNRDDIITLIKKEPKHTSFYSEEVQLYFQPDELRAPGTRCEIVEQIVEKPSDLTHEEMMQRLDALERREEDIL